MCLVNHRSGELGGKGALEPTLQEEFSASHTNAGESDEDGERRAGGNVGPPAGVEERLAALSAESRRAQSCNGEAGSGNEVNCPFPFHFLFTQGFCSSRRMRWQHPANKAVWGPWMAPVRWWKKETLNAVAIFLYSKTSWLKPPNHFTFKLKIVGPLKSHILQLNNKFMHWNMETPLSETITCFVEYIQYISGVEPVLFELFLCLSGFPNANLFLKNKTNIDDG